MRFLDWSGHAHTLPLGRSVTWRPSANAIVLDSEKVLLVRVKQHGLWELPGGGIEIGESVADGLAREVFEETGYRVRVAALTPLYMEDNLFYAPDIDEYFHALPMVFRADLVDQNQDRSVIDFEHEVYEVGWFSLAALPENLHARSRNALVHLP